MKIFIQSEGKALGPCSVEQIRSLLAGGWISPVDLAKYENEKDWRPISSLPEFEVADPIATANALAEGEWPKVAADPPLSPAVDSVQEVAVQQPLAADEPKQRKDPFWNIRRFSIKLPSIPFHRIPWRRIAYGLGVIASLTAMGYLGYYSYGNLRLKYLAYKAKKSNFTSSRPTNSAMVTTLKSTLEKPVAPRPSTNEIAVAWIASPVPAIMLNSNSVEATVMPEELIPVPSKRRFIAHSVDPKATPFGPYDVEFIQAIQKHWLEVLERHDIVKGRSGKVVVEFHLSPDGKVTNLRVVESTADEMLAYLCQKAIQEQSPWTPWPEHLRVLVKEDNRQMRFTFYY